MIFTQISLPTNCWGKYKPALIPSGAISHYMSASGANKIGLDNSDPFDIDVCVDILKHYGYSAHVLIGRDGTPYQLVPFNKRAYHAGYSLLDSSTRCNDWCLSVELLSTGRPSISGEPAFTEEQIACNIDLFKYWVNRFNMPREHFAGHDTVRANAIRAGMTKRNGKKPSRKYDPGRYYPWPQILNAVFGKT